MIDIINIIKSALEGIIIGFMASMPLGPIGVICIQKTLSKGRQAGFASGLGAATSDFIYAIVAGLSVSLIIQFIEDHKAVLTWVGAIVLIGLGLKLFFQNPMKQMRKKIGNKTSLWQDYITTFALTFTNPLAIFIFISLFTIFGLRPTTLERLTTILCVGIGASLWWLTLTLLVGLFRKKITLRRMFYLNRIAGSTIIILVMAGLLYEPFMALVNWIIS